MKHNAIPNTNKGIATTNLFTIGPCLYFKESAIVSLALLNAVSPEVIGHATTPSNANAPPTFPKIPTDILLTTTAADPASASYGIPPKNDIAAANYEIGRASCRERV